MIWCISFLHYSELLRTNILWCPHAIMDCLRHFMQPSVKMYIYFNLFWCLCLNIVIVNKFPLWTGKECRYYHIFHEIYCVLYKDIFLLEFKFHFKVNIMVIFFLKKIYFFAHFCQYIAIFFCLEHVHMLLIVLVCYQLQYSDRWL
jgi:hypothetical protein